MRSQQKRTRRIRRIRRTRKIKRIKRIKRRRQTSKIIKKKTNSVCTVNKKFTQRITAEQNILKRCQSSLRNDRRNKRKRSQIQTTNNITKKVSL